MDLVFLDVFGPVEDFVAPVETEGTGTDDEKGPITAIEIGN